jgi:hypothetical protein
MNGVKPGWFNKIDLSRFDIQSPCRCVLGQCFGEYEKYVNAIEMKVSQRVELGFSDNDLLMIEEVRLLDELWITTIRALQEPHKVILPVSPAPAMAADMSIAK